MFRMYLSKQQQRGLMMVMTLCWFGFLLHLAFKTVPDLRLQPYDTEGCAVSASKSSASLQVFGSALLTPLLPLLCNSTTVANHFNQVNLTWQRLQPDDLVNGRYQLIWSRPEVLKGVLHNFEIYYQELWTYPNYPVYWLTSHTHIDPTPAFFRGQIIGLLSDVNSHSGYQLPVAALQNMGIELSQTNHKFYADRQSLSKAAREGEITLYPAVLFNSNGNMASELDQSELYDSDGFVVAAGQRLQMPGLSNGGRLYLHKRLEPLRCELRQLISGYMLPLVGNQSAALC